MDKLKRGLPAPHPTGLATIILTATLLHSESAAQACVKPADVEWRKVVLVDKTSPVKLDKPTGMSFLPDGRILISEVRSMGIKLYTPGTGLSDAGRVSPDTGVGNGFMGLAVDPGFAVNHWVYVFFARKVPGANFSAGDNNVIPHEHVLARMTFVNGKLGNLKDILVYKRQTRRHGGGGMAFNSATGELYIPTGDDVYPLDPATYWGGRTENTPYLNDLGTAANTNDLRGKVLRIKPIPFADNLAPSPGAGSTYTVPEGNLFPPSAIGALSKTRVEIYTMGHRNPYKVKIDGVSGAVLIGEVGPDAPGPEADRGPTGSDEFNLATGPGNFGWPFAIADNQPYIAFDNEAYPKGTVFDVKNLKNKSKANTGLEDLPQAIGAMGYYNAKNSQTGANTGFGSGGEAAIAGPYYRFDPARPSVKLPPFFHGKYIAGDWSRGKIWCLELDGNKALKKVEFLWNAAKLIDLEIGPDGALFVLILSTGSSYEGDPETGILYKMEFTGAQYPVGSCPQYVLPAAVSGLAATREGSGGMVTGRLIRIAYGASYPAPVGSTFGTLYDLSGARIWEGAVHEGRITLSIAGRPSGGALGFLRFE